MKTTTKPRLNFEQLKMAFNKAVEAGLNDSQKQIIDDSLKRTKEEGKGKKAFIDDKPALVDAIKEGRRELAAKQLTAPKISPKNRKEAA